jgi:WD40 repeat protein
MLATAGDDGNVLLWVPSENPAHNSTFGEDAQDDVETWRVKTMCRSSSGSEIYDLAWSPDGMFFITGSMDNVARIYSATNGTRKQRIASQMEFHGLTTHRYHRTTNSRAQPLRTRSRVGSAERVCCDTVVGQVCSHLHTQDERWPVQFGSAQQSHEDGSTSKAYIVK